MVLEPRSRASPGRAGFGEGLRAAREKRGLSLRQISQTTKITLSILEALEHGDASKLPGGIFSRSFVRSYATEVGLDPDETVREFQRAFPEHAPVVEPAPEKAVDALAGRSGRRPAVLVLLAFVALAGGTAVLLLNRGLLTTALSPAAESRTAEAPVTPPRTASEPVVGDAESTVEDQRPPTSGEVPVGPAAPPLRIAIHPRADCWVRLVVDGRVAFARLMRAGEREEREAAGTILVDVGDAGAFDYSLNDAPGRSLGTSGQVVRARIERSNLEDFVVR